MFTLVATVLSQFSSILTTLYVLMISHSSLMVIGIGQNVYHCVNAFKKMLFTLGWATKAQPGPLVEVCAHVREELVIVFCLVEIKYWVKQVKVCFIVIWFISLEFIRNKTSFHNMRNRSLKRFKNYNQYFDLLFLWLQPTILRKTA